MKLFMMWCAGFTTGAGFGLIAALIHRAAQLTTH